MSKHRLPTFDVKGVMYDPDESKLGTWRNVFASSPRLAAQMVAQALSCRGETGRWSLIVLCGKGPEVIGRYETTVAGPAVGALHTLAVA